MTIETALRAVFATAEWAAPVDWDSPERNHWTWDGTFPEQRPAGRDAKGAPVLNLFFETPEDRQAFLEHCKQKKWYNYYIGWKDANGMWGLSCSWAMWVGEGQPHVNL